MRWALLGKLNLIATVSLTMIGPMAEARNVTLALANARCHFHLLTNKLTPMDSVEGPIKPKKATATPTATAEKTAVPQSEPTTYEELHAEWVKVQTLKSPLKSKLAKNQFLFPYVIVRSASHLYDAAEIASINELFFASLNERSQLTTQEAAELETWILKHTSGEKNLLGLQAQKYFKKLLEFEGHDFNGVALKTPRKELEKKRSVWAQFRAFPETVRRLVRITNELFQPSTLDENLFAFYGFHQATGDKYYGQRSWDPLVLPEIDGSSIENISDVDFTNIMVYAMEVEDPIMGYSMASGQGFRYLLPNLGRFMGKNIEQADYIRELVKLNDPKGQKWCNSPWCEEERRHGGIWAKLVEVITGIKPSRDNSVVAEEPESSEAGAVRHLSSRMATEWSATSSYLLLSAHSAEGSELRKAVNNVAADEIKHLTILSSVQVHLFGQTPWTRLKNMIQISLASFKEHKEERTTGANVSSNLVTFAEVVVAHVLVETKMRKFMKTLPIGELRDMLESESRLTPVEAVEVPPEVKAQALAMQAAGQIIRDAFLRWSPKAQHAALRQTAFEKINSDAIDEIVRKDFNDFEGAENFESVRSSQCIEQINRSYSNDRSNALAGMRGWAPNGPKPENLRIALYNRLRAYQIRNNRHVREKLAENAAEERVKAAASLEAAQKRAVAQEQFLERIGLQN